MRRSRFSPAKTLKLAVSLLALLVTAAILAAPARAATSIEAMDRTAIAVIVAFGVLLFAIVFEVWRLTLRKPVPLRDRATSDWSAPDRNRHD